MKGEEQGQFYGAVTILTYKDGTKEIISRPQFHKPIPNGMKRYCCTGKDREWNGHDAICGGCDKYMDKPIKK